MDTTTLIREVQGALAALADPERAAQMARYLKTTQPFYGVQAQPRREIAKAAARRHPPSTQAEYEAATLALWALPEREPRYVAIAYARHHERFITPAALPLYERMIREGAWWDFVDEIASRLVGGALAASPNKVWPVLDAWIDDPHLWIRRAAILAQLQRKTETDHERLFDYCVKRMDESEFFIRKAIGWALRAYSYVAPETVTLFLIAYEDDLSGLSFREGARVLKKRGYFDQLL